MLNIILLTLLFLPTVSYTNMNDKYIATAYCLKGKTASGLLVKQGLIAADTRLHKLGSKVRINGKTYTVADTGGAIKGKRVDIWFRSCGEARKFGRKTVILDKL